MAMQPSPATTQFYFAYGSNMDEEQMAGRCPDALLIGNAILSGYKFMINNRGVATVVLSEDKCVLGLVWRISEKCEAALDRHEGVKKGIYRKELCEVAGLDGRSVSALIYIASDVALGVPRPEYLEKIICAAEKNGFAEDYLQELKGWHIRSGA